MHIFKHIYILKTHELYQSCQCSACHSQSHSQLIRDAVPHRVRGHFARKKTPDPRSRGIQVMIKNKLTGLCGNLLLHSEFINTLFYLIQEGLLRGRGLRLKVSGALSLPHHRSELSLSARMGEGERARERERERIGGREGDGGRVCVCVRVCVCRCMVQHVHVTLQFGWEETLVLLRVVQGYLVHKKHPPP